ncbi:hypothetical protein NXX53_19335 [Bacteroides salyersiae]|nr:hypothetical protein [Bacteroides salyersiae]
MKARSSLSVIVFAARMPGTHHPYARCSSPVCSVFIARIPNTWETFAQRQKNDNRPSPSIADEQSSEAKR